MIAALSKKIESPLGPFRIKAKAMEEAVIFVRDTVIQDIILESDLQIVVNALLSGGNCPASIFNVLYWIEILR